MAEEKPSSAKKIQQPILAVETEHVDVIQAKTNYDILGVKQPLSAIEDAKVLKTAGQRHINMIWESVQAIIALGVTGTGMYVTSVLALRDDEDTESKAAAVAALVFITGVANLIVGFYFGRANHANVGGTGSKDENETR